MSKEPKVLVKGKAFHKLIQQEWEEEAEDNVKRERYITKKTGRKGRVDIFIDDDNPDSTIAIIEIKATDWDRIKMENINRNIKRQIRQITNYIESQIIGEKYTDGGEHKDVCPGIIYPKPPKDKKLKEKIENDFIEYGIVVTWHSDD